MLAQRCYILVTSISMASDGEDGVVSESSPGLYDVQTLEEAAIARGETLGRGQHWYAVRVHPRCPHLRGVHGGRGGAAWEVLSESFRDQSPEQAGVRICRAHSIEDVIRLYRMDADRYGVCREPSIHVWSWVSFPYAYWRVSMWFSEWMREGHAFFD